MGVIMTETMKKEYDATVNEAFRYRGSVSSDTSKGNWVADVSLESVSRAISNAGLGLKCVSFGTKQYTKGIGTHSGSGVIKKFAVFEGESTWMGLSLKTSVEVWQEPTGGLVEGRKSQIGYDVTVSVGDKFGLSESMLQPALKFARQMLWNAIAGQGIAEDRAASLKRTEGVPAA